MGWEFGNLEMLHVPGHGFLSDAHLGRVSLDPVPEGSDPKPLHYVVILPGTRGCQPQITEL